MLKSRFLTSFLVSAALLSSFSGCSNKECVSVDREKNYGLDHIDTYYMDTPEVHCNDSEWECGHFFPSEDGMAFSLTDSGLLSYNYESRTVKTLDYADRTVVDKVPDGLENKEILSARFSGEKLVVLSYIGDLGFESCQYFTDVFDVNAELIYERSVSDVCNTDIYSIGISDSNDCVLFSNSKVCLFSNADGSRKEYTIKEGIIKDVKLMENKIYVLYSRGEDVANMYINVMDDSFGNMQTIKLATGVDEFIYSNELYLNSEDSLICVADDQVNEVCNWEYLCCNRALAAYVDHSGVRFISKLWDSSENSGSVSGQNCMYYFAIRDNAETEPKLLRMAALGQNDTYNPEFFVRLFNLIQDDYRLELTSYEINEDTPDSLSNDLRNTYLKMLGEDYDFYFFCTMPPLSDSAFDSLLSFEGEKQLISDDEFYTDIAFGCGRDLCTIIPFFTLAGAYYSEKGFTDHDAAKTNRNGMELISAVVAVNGIDASCFPEMISAITDEERINTSLYSDNLCLDYLNDITKTEDVTALGFHSCGLPAPVSQSCGAFSINSTADPESARSFMLFLYSELIQSMSYGDNCVMPVSRKCCENQVMNYLYMSRVHAYCLSSEEISDPVRRQVNKECIRLWLDSIDSVKYKYCPDFCIQEIFCEEYLRYANNEITHDEFINAYLSRVSVYIDECSG